MGERWEVGPYKFKRCPIKVITNEGLEYLEAYKFYKAGQLPVKGGWLDQTNTLVEAVRVIDEQMAKIQGELKKSQNNGV